ncbi:hypothetical protein ACFLZV_01230 [Candidatus Margulisiibacteriota bacterium]
MGETTNDDNPIKIGPSGIEYKTPENKVTAEMEAHYTSAIHTPTEKRFTERDIASSLDFSTLADEIDSISTFFESLSDNPAKTINDLITSFPKSQENKSFNNISKSLRGLLRTITNITKSVNKSFIVQFLAEYKKFIATYISDRFGLLKNTNNSSEKSIKIIEDFIMKKRAKYQLSTPKVKELIRTSIDKPQSITEAVAEIEDKKKAENESKNIFVEILSIDQKAKKSSAAIFEPIIKACDSLLKLTSELNIEAPKNNKDNEADASGKIKHIL